MSQSSERERRIVIMKAMRKLKKIRERYNKLGCKSLENELDRLRREHGAEWERAAELGHGTVRLSQLEDRIRTVRRLRNEKCGSGVSGMHRIGAKRRRQRTRR